MSANPASAPRAASLRARLRRVLSGGSGSSVPVGPLLARLDAIEARLAALDRPAAAPPPPAALDGSAAALPPGDAADAADLRAGLAALEKQIGRAGREQFKATALAEANLEQLTAALAEVRAAGARQETALALLRDQAGAAQAGARLDVVRAILPALDGLDEALRAGRQVLARPVPPPPWWARLVSGDAAPAGDAGLRAALAAWLDGLAFVRQRLLTVLAAEGVQPMAAEHQPFDATYHLALEAVPATATDPPGTVVAEIRRGYLLGDRVLRYAEVAVSK